MNINAPTMYPGRATERDLDERQAALAIAEQQEATERMKQHHRAAFSGAASTKPPIKGCTQQGRHPQAAECSTDVGADDEDDGRAHWAAWPFISACAVTCCIGLAFGIPALWHFIAAAIR